MLVKVMAGRQICCGQAAVSCGWSNEDDAHKARNAEKSSRFRGCCVTLSINAQSKARLDEASLSQPAAGGAVRDYSCWGRAGASTVLLGTATSYQASCMCLPSLDRFPLG